MAIADVSGTETLSGMAVHPDIVATIGNTPLIRLNSVGRELPCQLLAKVEFFNPGGSVKDRIGPAIIEAAERSGALRPGGTIVEATSGNTGVGLALAAATRGYRCIFVMPDKMSQEKIQLLRAFGARVVVTPTAVEPDDPRSYYKVAERLVEETPNAILADQYQNPVNPQAHYETTGPEIWEQTAGRVSHFVAGMGTGGTITGAGRFLKEKNPAVKVIGADPIGSILYELHRSGKYTRAESYKVEGIGEDFLPGTTDLSVVDEIVQVSDQDSFLITRRLVREEGIFCGGSSGTAVWAAMAYAREHHLGPDDIVVIIIPDSGSRYLSKVFSDDWMRENSFLERAWIDLSAADVQATKGEAKLITARPSDRLTDVVALMKQHGISQLPVVGEDEQLAGLVREVDLLKHMLSTRRDQDATIEAVIDHNVAVVQPGTPLETLVGMFAARHAVMIASAGRVQGILTQIDLLDFLAAQMRQGELQ
jgi:cystathionine beta-synthase